MTIQAVLALVLAMVIFVASPGPGVLAVIARALSNGFFASLAFVLGIVVGDLTYLLFAILVLSAVATAFGRVFVIIKIIGGLYLVYLGVKSWQSAKNTSLDLTQTKDRGFLGGLLLTLANPKVILFYLGFLPGFVNLDKLEFKTLFLLIIIIVSVIFTVLSGYAYFASGLRRFFQDDLARAKLQRSSSVFLILIGLMVIIKK